MTAGHDTREAAQAECDRANRAPLKGVTLAPRRCGACNGVGHTKRSRECPRHPDFPCFKCGVRRADHGPGDGDGEHRFRARALFGEWVDGVKAAPAVKP